MKKYFFEHLEDSNLWQRKNMHVLQFFGEKTSQIHDDFEEMSSDSIYDVRYMMKV
jgi:hypothetical protein